MTESTPPRCSFCGKTQDAVQKLVGGSTTRICDECLDLCRDIVSEHHSQEECFRKLKKRGVVPACSFCGKDERQAKLVAGPAVYICAECVRRLS